MEITTIYLPEYQIEILEKLVQMGRFLNRSEALRVAVRELIERECNKMESEGKVFKKNDKKVDMRSPKSYEVIREILNKNTEKES